MDFQDKNKVLVWTIITLLIVNILTLSLLWVSRVSEPERLPIPGSKESLQEGAKFLEKELNLTKDQIQKFIIARNKHVEESKDYHNKIYNLKKTILEEVFKDNPDSLKIHNMSNEIGVLQSKLELVLAKHFNDLSTYCNHAQKEKLFLILNDMALIAEPGTKRW